MMFQADLTREGFDLLAFIFKYPGLLVVLAGRCLPWLGAAKVWLYRLHEPIPSEMFFLGEKSVEHEVDWDGGKKLI
jgi:hypothetical protein